MLTLTTDTATLHKAFGTLTLIGATVALAACGSPPDRTVLDDYSIFTRGPAPTDVPEAEYNANLLTDMDVDESSSRAVGEHESARFYAVLTDSTDAEDAEAQNAGVCFIVGDDELEAGGASCSQSPYDPDAPTVSVRIAATGGSVEAFLIPDETELDVPEGWQRVSDNVVVISDPQVAQPEVSGNIHGNEILLHRLKG